MMTDPRHSCVYSSFASDIRLWARASRRCASCLWSARGPGQRHRRPPRRSEGMLSVLMALLVLTMMRSGAGQQYCAGSTQKVCGRCPNQCLSCIPQDHNIKCPGASWGNTNSTFMNISCSVPPGVAAEQYPTIPIISPAYNAPLTCSGQIKLGLWPFDADNSTFTLDTMFRDPKRPTANVNSEFLMCVTLALTVESSGASDDVGMNEALVCKMTKAKRLIHDYSGLNVYVCMGINVRQDPYCNKGRWVQVISGACIGETVTANVELSDIGSRLLVRVGGPGDLTGCQPKFKLTVHRQARIGSCGGVRQAYGNCCRITCVNGYLDRGGACKCICPPGFVGVLCDKTMPHLSVAFTVFNRTRDSWWVASHTLIGKGQTEVEYTLISTLASLLGLLPIRVEFAFAAQQGQLGTGAQSLVAPRTRRALSGLIATGGGGRHADEGVEAESGAGMDAEADVEAEVGDMLQVYTDGLGEQGVEGVRGEAGQRREQSVCAKDDLQGEGLSRVDVRLLYTFDHELSFARGLVQYAVTNGTFEKALADKGIYLCVIQSVMYNYNAFGFRMAARDVMQKSSGMKLQDVLIILFIVLAVVVLGIYVLLQYLVLRSRKRDAERHLTEHKPIIRLEKQAVGWRLVHPNTQQPMHLTPKLNREMEAWYVKDWLQDGDPLFTFELPRMGTWTADFSSMRAFETTAGQSLICVQVKDGMTVVLDRSASQVDHFYSNRSVTITEIPPEADRRLLNQERTCSNYSALLRELKVDSPFVPPPPAGIQITIGGRMGSSYRLLLPPGMDYGDIKEFAMDAAPPKAAKRKYQLWMQQARDTTKYRLANEIHYPILDSAPPTADSNIFRLREIQENAEKVKMQKKIALHEDHPLGELDDLGIHHFSGRDLQSWQQRNYNKWRTVENEKEEFQKKIEKMNVEDDTDNMKLDDPRLPEALLREEIFRPHSSSKFMTKFGVVPPETLMRRSSISSAVSTSALSEQSSRSDPNQAARRRKSKVVEAEILDEVAV